MFNIVFVEPEIPQNAGSTARLCAAAGAALHLVGRLGFRTDSASVRRAGLDYWEHARVERHESVEALRELAGADARFFYFSSSARRLYTDIRYAPGDYLVFGRESTGLPRDLLERNAGSCFRIPILPSVRSLNLATAAGIVLYEALRQQGFESLAGSATETAAETR
ncbi:MAG: tRNA (cytidine(34)-2'-O)-methyltransferase [bacterium]